MYFLHLLRVPFFGFLGLEVILRTILLAKAWGDVPHGAFDLFKIYGVGAFFDTIVFTCMFSPFVLWRALSVHPGKIAHIFGQGVLFILLCALFFKTFGEVLFWDEFQARYNFIAIDYLVYTHEVSQNVRESYNIPLLLSFIGTLAIAGFYVLNHFKTSYTGSLPKFLSRLGFLAGYVVMIVVGIKVCESTDTLFTSPMGREISQNGLYTMAKAAIENGLDYERFYLTTKDLGKIPSENLLMTTRPHVKETHHNVVIVLMESMSAEFMKTFGNGENLTPNLDQFMGESIAFHNLYATGTRTVRGIEALILSTPPLPGQSIVKRPGNENLHGLGWEFNTRGYVTQFVYGGRSYFDNMQHFFGENGFDIIDRADFEASDITFENAWGVCDEDLFDKVIAQADKAHAAEKPFMLMTLTTSNHRPYTYPRGKIDLEPKVSHRSGGVKYSDYAIGQFVKKAQEKPWFRNTLFLFVADHTAGTVGKIEIDAKRYHIPAMIYAPHLHKPQKITQLVSQIDVPVTLMSLLGFKSVGKFLGRDALHEKLNRAFISNNQKVGYVEGDAVILLKPAKEYMAYKINGDALNDAEAAPLLAKMVEYYETASKWKEHFKR